MITADVHNRLYTILNSSSATTPQNWTSPIGVKISTKIDEALNRQVIPLERADSAGEYYLLAKFPPNVPQANLTYITLLVKRIPGKEFSIWVKMAVKKSDGTEGSEVFIVTTDPNAPKNYWTRYYDIKPGWTALTLRLSKICSLFLECQLIRTEELKVDADCNVYRIYFHDRLYANEELPEGYRLFPYDSEGMATVAEA